MKPKHSADSLEATGGDSTPGWGVLAGGQSSPAAQGASEGASPTEAGEASGGSSPDEAEKAPARENIVADHDASPAPAADGPKVNENKNPLEWLAAVMPPAWRGEEAREKPDREPAVELNSEAAAEVGAEPVTEIARDARAEGELQGDPSVDEDSALQA